MTRFYLDQAWFDSDNNSESEEDWESIASERPDWFEDNTKALEYVIIQKAENKLIKRGAIIVIVWLIDIDSNCHRDTVLRDHYAL
jgi:hypothetical protein